MMRLLRGLALLAPFALIVLWITMPARCGAWASGRLSEVLIAVIAALMGVSMTALVVYSYARFRLPRLIRAVERLAGGELGLSVGSKPTGGGLEGRFARAVDRLSIAL